MKSYWPGIVFLRQAPGARLPLCVFQRDIGAACSLNELKSGLRLLTRHLGDHLVASFPNQGQLISVREGSRTDGKAALFVKEDLSSAFKAVSKPLEEHVSSFGFVPLGMLSLLLGAGAAPILDFKSQHCKNFLAMLHTAGVDWGLLKGDPMLESEGSRVAEQLLAMVCTVHDSWGTGSPPSKRQRVEPEPQPYGMLHNAQLPRPAHGQLPRPAHGQLPYPAHGPSPYGLPPYGLPNHPPQYCHPARFGPGPQPPYGQLGPQALLHPRPPPPPLPPQPPSAARAQGLQELRRPAPLGSSAAAAAPCHSTAAAAARLPSSAEPAAPCHSSVASAAPCHSTGATAPPPPSAALPGGSPPSSAAAAAPCHSTAAAAAPPPSFAAAAVPPSNTTPMEQPPQDPHPPAAAATRVPQFKIQQVKLGEELRKQRGPQMCREEAELQEDGMDLAQKLERELLARALDKRTGKLLSRPQREVLEERLKAVPPPVEGQPACYGGLSANSKAMFDNLLELVLRMEVIVGDRGLGELYPEVRSYILSPASTFTVVETSARTCDVLVSVLRQPAVREAAATAGGSYTVRLSEYRVEPKLQSTLAEPNFCVQTHSVSSEPLRSNWGSDQEVVAYLKEVAALGFLRQLWVRLTMELFQAHAGGTACNPCDPVDVAAFLWALELSTACVSAGAPMVAQYAPSVNPTMRLSSQPSFCLDPDLHRLHRVREGEGVERVMPTPGANPGAAPAWCVAALLQSAGFTRLGEALERSEEAQGAPAILGINLPSAIFTSSGHCLVLHNEDFCLGTLNLRMLALPGFLPLLPKLWFFLPADDCLQRLAHRGRRGKAVRRATKEEAGLNLALAHCKALPLCSFTWQQLVAAGVKVIPQAVGDIVLHTPSRKESQHHSVLELAGFSAAEAANHGVSLCGPARSIDELVADFVQQAEHCRERGFAVREVPEVSAGIQLLAASSSWPQG